ncbi:DUF262 domain-containing protein [Anaerotignum sp.]|uniref:DUF262 domain-containing protein n=1 Tax=Anaerotignum sp. TaxID=2039241 RepID=UPI0028AD9E51|nr:DUF262 domain-containing protein [Anaerotignum sp.]
MDIKLLQNEVYDINTDKGGNIMNETVLNEKYEEGHNRIVTEQGSYKLPLLKNLFTQENYKLRPTFQRRITWDNKKRSKLIESFIINIPIPPVFIYEKDFDSYEVMDGLQRISAIISFYNDEFELEGLEEWSGLNGLKYSQLPTKIKEGIDRRQISTITLLKESAKTSSKADNMKKMVFERLNTGGVKLEPQEIRNALYDGSFNQLCIKLSENEHFRKLWNIKPAVLETADEDIETEEDAVLFANDNLYKRMYDVELVLRFFAMRHINDMQGQLSVFLDNCLINGNSYNQELQNQLSAIFSKTMSLAYSIFSEYAFCQYKLQKDKFSWTKPQRAIYDPMCLVIANYVDELSQIKFDLEKNKKQLEMMYTNNPDAFNGKKQSKTDIIARYNIIEKTILDILGK